MAHAKHIKPHITNMKEQILSNIDNPAQLERLYRTDKPAFTRTFNDLYPQMEDNLLVRFWNERLSFTNAAEVNSGRKELLFVVMASFIAGMVAKLPQILGIAEDVFYQRNAGFIALVPLTAYFAWKNRMPAARIGAVIILMLIAAVYVNVLPTGKSDSIVLACAHLFLFLWSLLGYSFVGDYRNNDQHRLAFLKYNGDLVVISTLILIAGGILTGVTIGLFSLIGFNIEKFYFENIVVFGLPAVPLVGTYLIESNPQLVGRVSPVIAKIFSPLVLIMLVAYLVAILYSGKDPYNDRDFLLIFNALLVGVMAIIFFSVAGTSGKEKHYVEIWILFLLSLLTAVVNGIALSAILFRISEWGITPNRAAVLGGNVLILVNLLTVTAHLSMAIAKKGSLDKVGKAISAYLPVYFVWTIVVVFLFPILFGFK